MDENMEFKRRNRYRSSVQGDPVIIVHNDDVTTLEASMCVSTIHISKRLRNGRLSSCMLRKAGQIIQQEVDAKDLFQVVSDALNVASRDQFKSVVFPALGMGGLRYPPYEVSMGLLRAIGKFYMEEPNSTVRTVHIAAFDSNDYVMQVFAKSAIHFCTVFNNKLSEFGTNSRILNVENLRAAEKRTSVLPATGITFWGKIRAIFQSSQYPKGELFRVKVTPTGDQKTCDLAFRNAYNEVKLQYLGR